MKYSDDDRMSFGKYKGTKLAEVPATYLLWLADKIGDEPKEIARAALRVYVDANRKALELEAADEDDP